MSFYENEPKKNLLNELFEVLEHSNYNWKHVAWIGTNYGKVFDLNEFCRKARKTNYYNGFGAQEIRNDLVIVLCDGNWIERREYDGSEWFQLVKRPVPIVHVKPTKEFTLMEEDSWEED